MDYISFLNDYVDEEHLSAMKSLVTLCRQFEPITLSFPLPSEEDDVEIHYYSVFQEKLCIGALAVCLFPYTTVDDKTEISYEVTAFIHPEYRRQGLFTSLLNTFLETEHLSKITADILFLSDRHCSAAVKTATAMNMKQRNCEYLMQLDVTNRAENINPLLRITKCKNRRLLARHYALIFNMSTDIGRNYVDMTLAYADNIFPFLIRIGNTPIGSGYLMHTNPQKSYLFSFGILPKYQGKGLGLASLIALKQFLPETCEKLTVQVSGNNIAACRLYQKAGFVLTQQVIFYGWKY